MAKKTHGIIIETPTEARQAERGPFHAGMAPKYHPTPVSGSHRKALDKELTRARAMTSILAKRAAETRAAGEAMIREAEESAFARAGTSACGPMASRSTPRPRSIKRSMAVIPGLRSPVRVAARRTPWILLRFHTCQRPACTTSRAGCAARNAARLASVRRRSFGNSRSGDGKIRKRRHERTHPPAAIPRATKRPC
jgi:hypothetical protein